MRDGARDSEMSERDDSFVQNHAAMIENLLELCDGFAALTRGQIGLPMDVDRIQTE